MYDDGHVFVGHLYSNRFITDPKGQDLLDVP